MASASSVVEKLPQLPFHVQLNISGRKASVQWKMQSEIGHLFGCALRISYAQPLTLKWMVETYTLDCITDAFQIPNEFESATFTFPITFTCLRSVENGY